MSPEGQGRVAARSQEGQEAELHLLQLQQQEWLGVAAPAPALAVCPDRGGILERGLRRHLKAQGLARPRLEVENKIKMGHQPRPWPTISHCGVYSIKYDSI